MPPRVTRAWAPPPSDRQHGLFTLRQAREAGLSPDQVRHRLARGLWVRVAGDAVMLAPGSTRPWSRVQAAALTWPDVVVCLSTAALLHRIPVVDDGFTHVITRRHRDSGRGIVVHQYPLDPGDVVRAGLGQVTTVRRTLIDCIGRLPHDQAEQLVTWAGTRELIDAATLDHAVARRPGAWGNEQRRRAARDISEGAYNPAERRLHTILRRAGITGWRGDQRIDLPGGGRARADVLFRRQRLVLEVDGLSAHGTRAFQDDRTRQNAIVGAGYTVLRFTWWDLVERPDDVVRQVTTMLARLSA